MDTNKKPTKSRYLRPCWYCKRKHQSIGVKCFYCIKPSTWVCCDHGYYQYSCDEHQNILDGWFQDRSGSFTEKDWTHQLVKGP